MFSNPHYPRRRSTLTPTPGTPRRKTEVSGARRRRTRGLAGFSCSGPIPLHLSRRRVGGLAAIPLAGAITCGEPPPRQGVHPERTPLAAEKGGWRVPLRASGGSGHSMNGVIPPFPERARRGRGAKSMREPPFSAARTPTSLISPEGRWAGGGPRRLRARRGGFRGSGAKPGPLRVAKAVPGVAPAMSGRALPGPDVLTAGPGCAASVRPGRFCTSDRDRLTVKLIQRAVLKT